MASETSAQMHGALVGLTGNASRGTQAVTRPQRMKWGAPGRLGGSPAPTVTSLHLDKSLTKGRLFGLLCASENEGSRT